MDLSLLWTIQAAPLAAFIAIQLLPKALKKTAPFFGILGALAAALASLQLLSLHLHDATMPIQYSHEWLRVAAEPLWPGLARTDYTLVVGFLVDRLNLLMITLVTTITLFVQIFSFYYMAEDPSRPRYFGFLSFFAFSMTGLVLSNNLLQTFLFWELVGLTSYLLIGFWYEKQSAATAARKAFVINRLGDLGFYLGVILLFIFFGSLNFTDLQSDALRAALSPALVTALGLLIFTGVMGKSAQFPLHVWLPDAMEGPTPVSALIHSATMVAAGVFLLARGFGLFGASTVTLNTILVIGSLTALTGAALATVQRDIKKILAYSTVSQLGLMVMAIGAGSAVSGMFHLSTHAYFKSLLFLTAGAFIHAFHSNDIWDIAKKGGRRDTLAMSALAFGLFSLCGIFPFAGFFSKDLILETLKEHGLVAYATGLFVSFLTVYYSFRVLFVISFSKIEHGAHPHHDSALLKMARAIPLVTLAVISLFVGFGGSPWNHSVIEWLGGHAVRVNAQILAATLVVIVAGAALAFWRFRDPEKAETRFSERPSALRAILENKFYMDAAYDILVKKVGLRIAALLDWFDRWFVNGVMVNRTSYGIRDLGRLVSRLQNGSLQDYLSVAVGIGAVIVLFLAYRGGSL